MKRTKVLAAFGLFAIAAIMGIVSLSSFSGKAEAKVPEVKKFDPITLFYHGAGNWQETPPQGVTCGSEGMLCSITYNDATVNRTPEEIADDVEDLYNLASSSGSTIPIDNGNGGTVTVTVFERSAQ